MNDARSILKTTFGYDVFRHQQEEVIQALLGGDDAFVLMPTGGGKSLCYQIPALMRHGVGVVVSPLIALMQDQVDTLLQLGLRAGFINSTQNYAQQQEIERQIVGGEIDIVYIAPERLLTARCLNILDHSAIALFAIDEAHCVSHWGHDFRKEYQKLGILHQRFPNVPRIALTATADKRTRQEIIDQLNLQQANIFVNSFDRPNIRYTIKERQNSREELWRFIHQQHPRDAGIVYCLSRKKVENVANWLSSKGRIALPYHAGLSNELRAHNQKRFLREESVIIVATIAFGMGIDKPNVRFVAHLNLPKSIEAYYQETGRAGRDGSPANAWLSYGLQDVILLRQMLQASDAEAHYKHISQHKLETMLGFTELTSCHRIALLAYFDETYDKPCGNCENCLNPPEPWDGTEAAQKALSCVYRTGQQFGVKYIIDVLCGGNDQRIKSYGHDKLSTYGIGKMLSTVEWSSVFRQLISLGFLDIKKDSYGSLYITEKARPLLRGEMPLQLRKPEQASKKTTARKKPHATEVRFIDKPLFDAIRAYRLQVSKESGVPPYIIFNDNTLLEITRIRPKTADELRYITGIGEYKLAQYGKSLLTLIKDFSLPDLLTNQLSDTINETLFLYTQKNSIEEITLQRDLTTATVYSHFAIAIKEGLIDARDIISLEKKEYDEIVYAIEMSDNSEKGFLTALYESFNQEYDYNILKCVQANVHAQQ